MSAGEKPAHNSQTNEETWRPPKKFANYILDSEIDTGGMGIIYKAYKMPEKKLVAIKFMIEQSQYKRFQREAATGKLLQHRNFVRFHDDGEVDGHFYIVMDYIDGKPLKKYLEKTNLSSAKRLELFHQIVRAIAYAHRQGIIHRDLKPGNILVDEEGEPVILDFGLVKNISVPATDQTALTISGQILGTPGYMSPEQARGEIDNQDERSDIFCLGIILYEMLTARNPFPGDNFLEICYSIAHKSAYPIENVLEGIPPKLAHICNTALARKKEDRYMSATEFAEAILDYLQQRHKSAEMPTVKYDNLPHQAEKEGVEHLAPQMPKIICTACGSMNAPTNINCHRCGNIIRKTSVLPKMKGVTSPKQPLQFVVQTPPVKTPIPKTPQTQPKVLPTAPLIKAPLAAPIKMSGESSKPILLTPDKEARDGDSKKIHWVVGAITMPLAMMPITCALYIPVYAYLLDAICGAIAEIWLFRFSGKGILGSIAFVTMGLLALLISVATSKFPLLIPYSILYLAIEVLLLLSLGASVGMVLKHNK